MRPWRGWYHCIVSTHGSWLPGDPRGFRTRHHREHVDGDYKHRPSVGQYEARHAHARNLLKRPPVVLDRRQRQRVCAAFAEKLTALGAQAAALSVSATHLHVLVRFQSAGMARAPQSPGMAMPGLSEDAPGLSDNAAGLSKGATGRSQGISALSPREVIGRAKKHSSLVLRQAGLTPAVVGGIWAVRGKITPIRNEHHYQQVRRYIANHASEGAVVAPR